MPNNNNKYARRVSNNTLVVRVVCVSPMGEVFRARLRQFPALVNCCTIDWFSAWPPDALQSVAMRFLSDLPELDTTDEVLDGLVCTHHQSMFSLLLVGLTLFCVSGGSRNF